METKYRFLLNILQWFKHNLSYKDPINMILGPLKSWEIDLQLSCLPFHTDQPRGRRKSCWKMRHCSSSAPRQHKWQHRGLIDLKATMPRVHHGNHTKTQEFSTTAPNEERRGTSWKTCKKIYKSRTLRCPWSKAAALWHGLLLYSQSGNEFLRFFGAYK